jgi:hypothetical protein
MHSLVNYEKRRCHFHQHCRTAGAFFAYRVPFSPGKTRGSLVEVETQRMITQNLAYFAPEHGRQWLDKGRRVRRMLNGLIGAIRPAA